MTRVLLTGMSGTGKTTLLNELARRGHTTIDTDYGGWVLPNGDWDEPRMTALLADRAHAVRVVANGVGDEADHPADGHDDRGDDGGGGAVGGGGADGGGGEADAGDEPRPAALSADRTNLIVSGTVANQGRFYDRFDHVVLLSAPLDVILARVARRPGNPYGKTARDRAEIEANLHTVEPLLRRGATLELDARHPLPTLADAVEALLA
ncbi:AAA family ATPase [Symbioplanes lichenis]|uniref:AAA family ATPase n=1 Tax=Symbioplanes lichenis TaxID=1629072 RepID=UPI0027389E14|nr:AAA family ATPase [Actinoplanes lichenis]